MLFTNILLIVTATATALVAGLFFAWSCSVMPGFARLSDREFISAMQATNRAIQNPVFFAAFFGAAILLPISAFIHYSEPSRFWFLLAATFIYLTGTFGVTVFGNVPLNNTLESFNLAAASEDPTALQRANFEEQWNNLNNIRSISSTIAVILVVIACLSNR